MVLGSWVAFVPGTLERALGFSYDYQDNWGVSFARYEAISAGIVVLIARAHGRRLRARRAGAGAERVESRSTRTRPRRDAPAERRLTSSIVRPAGARRRASRAVSRVRRAKRCATPAQSTTFHHASR